MHVIYLIDDMILKIDVRLGLLVHNTILFINYSPYTNVEHEKSN